MSSNQEKIAKGHWKLQQSRFYRDEFRLILESGAKLAGDLFAAADKGDLGTVELTLEKGASEVLNDSCFVRRCRRRTS